MQPVVLSLGSCGADTWSLSRAFKRIAGAELRPVHTPEEAFAVLSREPVKLVVVNRILDADGSEGVDFIAAAREQGVNVPLMLISDYEDAQAQAVANGAVPGFGKGNLQDEEIQSRLREVLQVEPPQATT